MSIFNENLPTWTAAGTEPTASIETGGFQPKGRLPASWMNWILHKIYALITDVRAFITDSTECSIYRLSEDSNNIFVELDFKRADGTMFKKSVLSGGTSPSYTTRTETYYAADGVTVTETKVYTELYNANSELISEVLN